MKKLVSTIVFFCLMAGAFAQKDLTSTQKNFQNSIVSFLKEEGYAPSIDSDGWIAFKSEGKTHWIRIYNDSPFLIVFSRSGFKVGGDDGYKFVGSLWACNQVNKDSYVAKLYCSNEHGVSVNIEQYTRSAEDFKYVFYKNVSSLATAAKKFVEEYDEYSKSTD